MQTLAILIMFARLVSPNPISDENQTSLCNVSLPSLLGNDDTSIMLTAVLIQTRVPSSVNTQALIDQLYNRVVLGDYEPAVTKCLQLELEGKSQVIIDTVKKLLNTGKRNTVEFAYKLWNMFGRNIVKDYFPIQFTLLLNEGGMVLSDKKHEVSLNIVAKADGDGNRLAFGDGSDKSSDRLRWNMKPIWEDNKLYFKIFNDLRQQYLKLGIAIDSIGEHKGYSENGFGTFRHQWFLHPTMYEDQLLFYVVNREYNQALKLAKAIDKDGNRQLWGNNGVYVGSPESLGWNIKPFE